MVSANGTLEDIRVLVSDASEASRLAEKGGYGERKGKHLILDLHEAAYLAEEQRLLVHEPTADRTLAHADIVALGALHVPGFETSYLSYRDLRARGFVVRHRPDGEFDVWQRGGSHPKEKPATLVAPRAEGASLAPRDLVALVKRAAGAGRGLLLAVVDEESDVTYYEVDEATVTGDARDPASRTARKTRALLLKDRALVRAGDGLEEAGYGNVAGGDRFLSLEEAWHLASHGLDLTDGDGKARDADDVRKLARSHRADADETLGAYAWLRGLGLVPKTGFKFGVHFRVYKGAPGDAHAPFLVHALAERSAWTLRDLARFVRLAHGVKKKGILWTPGGALMVNWVRP